MTWVNIAAALMVLNTWPKAEQQALSQQAEPQMQLWVLL